MSVPQVPNHDGSPQNGRTWQPCDPGPALGRLLTVTSSYGVEQFPECTFVGTEGVAQIKSHTNLEVARFDDAPFVLEQPVNVASDAAHVWGAQPRYVELRKDSIEVQQWGRRDTVAPKDLTVVREGGDLVLRAAAFYEARFIIGETPNATLLMVLLKLLAP